MRARPQPRERVPSATSARRRPEPLRSVPHSRQHASSARARPMSLSRSSSTAARCDVRTAGRGAQGGRKRGRRVAARREDGARRVAGERRGGVVGDDHAVVDDRDAPAQRLRLFHVVRRVEHRHGVLLAEAADAVDDVAARLRVDAHRRLVEEEQARRVRFSSRSGTYVKDDSVAGRRRPGVRSPKLCPARPRDAPATPAPRAGACPQAMAGGAAPATRAPGEPARRCARAPSPRVPRAHVARHPAPA